MTRRRLHTTTIDDTPSPSPSNVVNSSILMTVLILAVAVILSTSLYILLRFLRRHHNQHSLPSTTSSARNSNKISPSTNDPFIETLPLFTFNSLSSTAESDCAVCLSKFESQDLLRLLPICCHAFHADCIDTWLHSNQSCPLCRSPVFVPESELLYKFETPNSARISSSGSSFRVEIGNVSQRNNNEQNNNNPSSVGRSYSLGGNFDYVLNDNAISEVHSGSFRRTFSSDEFKVEEQGVLAAEIGTGGGGWLKEYLSNSLSSSFRSSGRWFFTGSSRRENIDVANANRVTELDLEASRLGDEIGELFRWLSGV